MKSNPIKTIEFCGLPRTGKTTVCNKLRDRLIKLGYKVHFIEEYASKNPIKDIFDPMFNLMNSYLLSAEFCEIAKQDNKLDYVIVDRGIVDSLIWIKFLSIRARLKSKIKNYQIGNTDYVMEHFNNRAFFFDFDNSLYFSDCDDFGLQEANEDKFSTVSKKIDKLILRGYKNTYNKFQNDISKRAETKIFDINVSEYFNNSEELIERLLGQILDSTFWNNKLNFNKMKSKKDQEKKQLELI